MFLPGIEARVYIPSIWEAEAGKTTESSRLAWVM